MNGNSSADFQKTIKANSDHSSPQAASHDVVEGEFSLEGPSLE